MGESPQRIHIFYIKLIVTLNPKQGIYKSQGQPYMGLLLSLLGHYMNINPISLTLLLKLEHIVIQVQLEDILSNGAYSHGYWHSIQCMHMIVKLIVDPSEMQRCSEELEKPASQLSFLFYQNEKNKKKKEKIMHSQLPN